jgi:uncharacterized protein
VRSILLLDDMLMVQKVSKLSIKAVPGSRKNEITGFSNDVWRIKIAAPPDKGKANKELIEFLSEILDLRKEDISIFKGLTSHNKIISVLGLNQQEVLVKLQNNCG